MKLEEMRKIANARTPGEWSSSLFIETEGKEDAKFIALSANTYNLLLDIAEIADEARKFLYWHDSHRRLDSALKKLEDL